MSNWTREVVDYVISIAERGVVDAMDPDALEVMRLTRLMHEQATKELQGISSGFLRTFKPTPLNLERDIPKLKVG